MRLEGKVALVTGGASGIGAATCRRLAAEGARVAVTDLNLEPAKEVAGEVDGEAFELDVLVNNAGYDEFGWFGQTDEAMWDRVLAVNLRGVLAVTHAVLGGMQQRGGGRIVNLASEAGRAGSAGSAVYSAAKAGVIGFTKALAQENGRFNITVNAIAPGPIETPLLMGARQLGEIGDRVIDGMVGKTVLRRLGQPEEVAAAVVFLASDDASYVTGQSLGVSGGLAML
ncbi:MAG TPA: SDR family oxidoreductase [Thermoleophilaceae bacterium]